MSRWFARLRHRRPGRLGSGEGVAIWMQVELLFPNCLSRNGSPNSLRVNLDWKGELNVKLIFGLEAGSVGAGGRRHGFFKRSDCRFASGKRVKAKNWSFGSDAIRAEVLELDIAA